tara:strand:- start:51 stop:377 length:327 start_codon:yes stop_codon:yes gene_type:complete
MANTFKNAGGALPIAYPVTPIYSAPAATQSIVHSCIISNVHATDSADVDIKVQTDGSNYYHIAKNVPVPAGSSLVIDKPIDMEASDDLAIKASAVSTLEAVLGILEIT